MSQRPGNNNNKDKKKKRKKPSTTTTLEVFPAIVKSKKSKKGDTASDRTSACVDEEDIPLSSEKMKAQQMESHKEAERTDASSAETGKEQVGKDHQDLDQSKPESDESKPINLESVAAVKNRIRGLKRLLSKVLYTSFFMFFHMKTKTKTKTNGLRYNQKRDTFPEDVVREKEKEIEKLEASIDSLKKMREKEAKDREIDKKYRMVKFFGKLTTVYLQYRL